MPTDPRAQLAIAADTSSRKTLNRPWLGVRALGAAIRFRESLWQRTAHHPLPLLRTFAVILLSALAVPRPSFSATTVTSTNGRMTISAELGVANVITISDATGQRIEISDAVSVSGQSGVCTALGSNKTRCTRPVSIKVKLRDQDDLLVSTTSVPMHVRAGPGANTVVTGSGDDTVIGGGGHDFIATGFGRDTLKGQGGDDYLNGGPGPRDGFDTDRSIAGGPGFDVGNYALRFRWPSVTANLVADDGEPGENDNTRVEMAEARPFNFDYDAGIVTPTTPLYVNNVWSGSAADFALTTNPTKNLQTIAYYNTSGLMTVAARRLGESSWYRKILPTHFAKPRDGHRAIRITFDTLGLLHVAGNMHGGPMQYFRTSSSVTQPSDLAGLAPAIMTGQHETSPTYPEFIHARDGRLKFIYREGSTDQADWYINVWNPSSQTWTPENAGVPLFSAYQYLGQPESQWAGAYYRVFEDDEWTHLLWYVKWRDPNLCTTAPVPQDFPQLHCLLSYVRTQDWKTFYNASGTQLTLPLTPDRLRTQALIIQPTRVAYSG